MSDQKYIEYLRTTGVTIGDNCEIYKDARFGSERFLIVIGNHVRINSGVSLITHDGGVWVLRDKCAGYGNEFMDADCFGMIRIGNNVHIGTNATIMPGVTIGENCIVACNAVVTHDIPSNTIVGGVPARVIEDIDEYAKKMRKKYIPTKHLNWDEKAKVIKRYFGIEQQRDDSI